MTSTPATDIREINTQLEARCAMLFLGSGATRNCLRPDGKRGLDGEALAAEILRETNGGEDPGFQVNLMKAAEFYTAVKASARLGLDRFIRERLDGLQPTIGHLVAASFPWRAVVTTNYNRVLEDAWAVAHDDGFAARPLRAIRTDEDLAKAGDDHGAVRLYKPHGCITLEPSGQHRMVLTSRDYFESERVRPSMYAELRALARQCTTVFVGYSLEDFTFRNIFYRLHADLGDWACRSYSVSPFAEPLRFEWLSRSMASGYGTTVIDDTFDAFMLRLASTRGDIAPPLAARIAGTWDRAVQDNMGYLDGLDPASFSP